MKWHSNKRSLEWLLVGVFLLTAVAHVFAAGADDIYPEGHFR